MVWVVLKDGIGGIMDGMGGIMRWYGWYYEMSMGGIKR